MTKIKMFISRDVKTPNRATSDSIAMSDAGLDFYVPKMNEEFVQDLINKNPHLRRDFADYIVTNKEVDNGLYKKGFYVDPHSSILIPSGITVQMDMNDPRALIAYNKSGVATKTQFVVGACVVDNAYRGEIHIHLINTSPEHKFIYEDMKATQFIEVPIIISDIEVVNSKDKLDTNTSRGDKGFGSSDFKYETESAMTSENNLDQNQTQDKDLEFIDETVFDEQPIDSISTDETTTKSLFNFAKTKKQNKKGEIIVNKDNTKLNT